VTSSIRPRESHSERHLDRHAVQMARAESSPGSADGATVTAHELLLGTGWIGAGSRSGPHIPVPDSPRKRQRTADGHGPRLVLSLARVVGLRRWRRATRVSVSVALGHGRGCRDGGLVPTSGIRLESARVESSQLPVRAVHSSRFRESGRRTKMLSLEEWHPS